MKTLSCMALTTILLAHPGVGVAAERGGRDEQRAVRQTLAQYPAEVGPVARKWVRRDARVLAEIAALNQRAETNSTVLLSNYPAQAQDQARLLLQYPEFVELLEKDLDQVVLLGDAYRQDPGQVRQQLAQLYPGRSDRTPPDRVASRGKEVRQVSRSRADRYDYDLNGLDEPEGDDRIE